MKTFPLMRGVLPALMILTGAGCQQQDGQMQARLADAEARAKLAETAMVKLKQTVEDLEKEKAAGGSGGASDSASSEALAALKQENETLREKIATAGKAGSAGSFLPDIEAIEKAFTEGVRERRKEWKEALADYKVLSYETPEVSAEDVKPFKTNLAIKLEQAGRVFTALVPVAADFQGNWSFPSPAEVLSYAKQAQAGGGIPANNGAPVPGGNTYSSNTPASPPPAAAQPAPPAPAPQPQPDAPEPIPFGAKSMQKLPPIKFPGDP